MNIEEISKEIDKSSLTTNVYIGCDSGQRRKSKNSNEWCVKWAIVLVLHIDGRHGGKYWVEIRTENRKERMGLRERLMKEIYFSLEIALAVEKFVGPRLLEVHGDINQKMIEKSAVVLKEARGLIEGSGFIFKPKPSAFAATYVADYALDKEWPKAGFRK